MAILGCRPCKHTGDDTVGPHITLSSSESTETSIAGGCVRSIQEVLREHQHSIGKPRKRVKHEVHKHPPALSPSIPIYPPVSGCVVSTKEVILGRIKSFTKGTPCGRDGLRVQHLLDDLTGPTDVVAEDFLASISGVVNLWLDGLCSTHLREYVSSAPLTPLLKPDGGIRPVVVGTGWRRLVVKDVAHSVGKDMCSYLEDFQFGVGVPCVGRLFYIRLTCSFEKKRFSQGHSCQDYGVNGWGEEVGGSLVFVLFLLPLSHGGLGLFSMGDAIHYCYLASMIQTQTLQSVILRNISLSGPDLGLKRHMDLFSCAYPCVNVHLTAPHSMKFLAVKYFEVVMK
ncbi:hypothetical protein C5167_021530 [Papaver somniferum]|nr:hypothetical protein C5167_021530 [Papaver somniferum]